ncbi:MAG: 30S ribosome-binding factor RbfA [Pseudobdellovibrio sp.]
MKNMGDGRRKIRVEKEVQEVISGFIIRQLRHDLPGVVTVTRVMMPTDFRTASVHVSYFAPVEGGKEIDVAEVLQSWASDIQDEIGHVMKMRYCPKITFYNDETTEKILKIEKIIDEISRDPSVKSRLEEDED